MLAVVEEVNTFSTPALAQAELAVVVMAVFTTAQQLSLRLPELRTPEVEVVVLVHEMDKALKQEPQAAPA
jgi:hypothetical protein